MYSFFCGGRGLASLSQHNSFEIQPCCHVSAMLSCISVAASFLCRAEVCCMAIPPLFIYLPGDGFLNCFQL